MAEDDGLVRESQQEDRGLLDAQWQRQQIKSFTAWTNSHLQKAGMKIESLQTDFKDGSRLIKLIEIIGGEQLRKPEKGKMKLHCIQNLNIALDAITAKKVKITVSSEEIYAENLKLILGMIWTLILRFQIQDISVEELSAKEGLLLWCQRKTAGYKGCNVQNFHVSFQDGNAFCALINRHRPDLLDYSTLGSDKRENLNLAFRVAEEHLDIPQMLDADDMLATSRPDERSVMTYVAAYYHAFSSSQKTDQAARRLSVVLKMNREFQQMMDEYDTRTSDLLAWIGAKTEDCRDCTAAESLEGVMDSFQSFREYKNSEKPPKAEEKASIEAHYTTLQTKLRLNNRPSFHPAEGRLVTDVQAAWDGLNAAEKEREKFLRDEQTRLERLERIAKRFDNKANIHERWVGGKGAVAASQDYGDDVGSVTLLIKQHAAFESDVQAHAERVSTLRSLVDELSAGNYYKASETEARATSIEENWSQLLSDSAARKQALDEALAEQERLDEMRLQFAKMAVAFNTWCETSQEDLLNDINVDTIEALEQELQQHEEFKSGLAKPAEDLVAIESLASDMAAAGITRNVYTTLSTEDLTSAWAEVQRLAERRDEDLSSEKARQEDREALRVRFADAANKLGSVLEETKHAVSQSLEGTLEDQLASMQGKSEDVNSLKPQLDSVNVIDRELQEAMIYENKHASHSMPELNVAYEQLRALVTRNINTLENQIMMRDESGITEDQMKELRDSFKHFDKNNDQLLDRNEFRSCLLSSGYDVPESGEQFDIIMAQVDPTGAGVSFEAFVNFMSKDKVDTNSSEQFKESFRMLAGGKDFITADEIRRELSPQTAEYVLSKIQPYPDVDGGLDYQGLAADLFN